MLDEPVHLVVHDRAWAAAFAQERRRLAAVCSLYREIEHIGSTAVPLLLAKPVIDLMLGAESFPPPAALTVAIENAGYSAFGEAGVPGRLYFRRRAGAAFNLHVVAWHGAHWRNNIALRDYLRCSPAARDEYAEAKLKASAGGAMLLAYSNAKAAVVERLLQWALSGPAGRRTRQSQ